MYHHTRHKDKKMWVVICRKCGMTTTCHSKEAAINVIKRPCNTPAALIGEKSGTYCGGTVIPHNFRL